MREGFSPGEPAHPIWQHLGRAMSFCCYPLIPAFVFLPGAATVENCKLWSGLFPMMGLSLAYLSHSFAYRRFGSDPMSWQHILAQGYAFLFAAYPFTWGTIVSVCLAKVFSVDRSNNRLKAGKLHGSRVIVIGNGPSAAQGEPLGDEIDKFDEVVRFNNFQTKTAGLEKFVGTKTTVHYSDGVLFPTYQEYHVPGATVMLSLIKDRFIIAVSYIGFRMCIDLQVRLTWRFLMDPALYWMESEQIERLKKELGIHKRHPTSGMLAIDYFVHKEGVQLPVYIHGFDFFMGPKMHYFSDHEPLYERINDRIGVNMHCPWKEKVLVERLVQEGKVAWLKDVKKTK